LLNTVNQLCQSCTRRSIPSCKPQLKPWSNTTESANKVLQKHMGLIWTLRV